MKKINITKTIIALAITLFTTNTYAQNFYTKLNAGYNWGFVGIEIANVTETGTVTSYEKGNLSLGKGVNLCGAFGYMFNKNIGAELGVNYLVGGTTEFTYKSNDPNNPNNYSNSKFIISSTLFSFIPSIVITTDYEKINPYAKIGFSVGTATATSKFETTSSFAGITNSSNQTRITNGGIALGLVSAIGATYNINDNFSLFGELNISSINYSPTKAEVTESKMDGVDMLPNIPTSQKITEYVDSYTANSDPNVSSKQLTVSIPFSSVGLNIGVKYSF